jgi:hypothetical protein
MPSPNPSQGEAPFAAFEAADTAVIALRTRAPGSSDADLTTVAVKAAYPAIRSQIDQEWEERFEAIEKQRELAIENGAFLLKKAEGSSEVFNAAFSSTDSEVQGA